MALRYCDGFDNVTANDLGIRWVLGASADPRLIVAGRLGGGAVRVNGHYTGGPPGMSRWFDAQATVVVGAAVRIVSGIGNTNGAILALREGGANQLSLTHTVDGRLQVRRGDWQGTVIATGAAAGRAIAQNIWSYVEWRVTIHPSAGAFEVRVDGEVWLSATGQNTRATAISLVDSLVLGASYYPGGGGTVVDTDDLYICDTTGSANTDFLGDVRVQTLRPSASGASGDFALPAGQTVYSTYRDAVLADSPLHFWELQETSGTAAADTGTGTAQAVAWTATTVGAAGPRGALAAEFPAGGAGFGLAAHQADMNLTGNLTVEGWCYATTTVQQFFVARGAASAWTFAFGTLTDGRPRWLQGNGGFDSTVATSVPIGRWFHYAAVRIGNVVTFYVDGAVQGSTTVTQASSSGTNPVLLGNSSSGSTPGTVPWIGRIAYVALYGSALPPARIQNHRAFAPWAALDEFTPDAETSYVVGTTVAHRSTYAFENTLPATAAIKGVQLVTVVRKDDAGVRSAAPVVRSGSMDYTGATAPLSTSYAAITQRYETDPNTAAAWTKAGLDGAEFGVEVTA